MLYYIMKKSLKIIILAIATAVFLTLGSTLFNEWKRLHTSGKTSTLQTAAGQEVQLLLKKTYVCGVDNEEKIKKTVSSIDQVFNEYPDWQFVSRQDNHFVFQKKIEDLAPVCKEKGYFGLSDTGFLTFYKGLPEDHKVIQAFFKLNQQKMEFSLPPHELELLRKGIHVSNLAEYNSVLSTYGGYAGNSSF